MPCPHCPHCNLIRPETVLLRAADNLLRDHGYTDSWTGSINPTDIGHVWEHANGQAIGVFIQEDQLILSGPDASVSAPVRTLDLANPASDPEAWLREQFAHSIN